MSQPWVILTTRYGGGTRNPTAAQLSQAIAELYHETLPGMTDDDYAEHGAAFLEFGFDDGPMFVIAVDRLGTVAFEEWADQDYRRELVPPRKRHEVPEEEALRLWNWLADGEIDRLRSQPWD